MSDHWLDRTDPTFVADLIESRRSVLAVAIWLRGLGYTVTVPETVIRPDPSVRRDYADAGDVVSVVKPDGSTADRVEVKGRPGMTFTVDRFPYRSVMFGAVHRVDHPDLPTAEAHVVVSGDFAAAGVVKEESRPRRTRKTVTRLGRPQETYLAELDDVRFFALPPGLAELVDAELELELEELDG